MKIDFLNELLTLIKSTGVTPEQYMIEHSLFFDKAVVDDAFNELLTKFNKRQPIHVRKTTKKMLIYQVGNRNVWSSVYKNIPDLDVIIDSDGNRKVRSLITSLTGETISQGVNSSIMFGKISHIWGEATNPLFFTALWNIVLVPAYFNDILDKNVGTDPFITKIKEIYKSICWKEYDVENKLKALGLTQQEINWYAPNVSVLNGFSYKLNTIPMKAATKPITTTTTTTSSTSIIATNRINSRSVLKSLKSLKAAGNLPAVVTLTNSNSFGSFLSTIPAVNNGYSIYMRSIETQEFNDLLKKHGLPKNIYKCKDMNKLVSVLDELVNAANTPQADAALQYGARSCRPALCYLIKYLLSKMGVFI